MTRPLLITDCDEVLLHMVVPFRQWLDEVHGIHFDFSRRFERALRHKNSGDPIERARMWQLLDAFFTTEMHRQTPIAGAVEALDRLSRHADIVILTNIGEVLGPAPGRAAARVRHGLSRHRQSWRERSGGRAPDGASPADHLHLY